MSDYTTDIVLIIGRPGSGKGTQAKLLSKRLGWIRLSSGDLIKQIRDGNEPFSARVREMYDKGTLLPDWFADYLLESGLLELDPHVGVVAEGFGRTGNQAKHLCEIASWLGRRLLVLNLDVSEEEVTRRMIERAKVEDRPDSNAMEKIRERLVQYTSETEPALEFFREKGLVVDVDGEPSPEEIARTIEKILKRA
ncbi:MAG TPA: nucleoside monophosphate kinase [Candidatus Paceibacterota bacterium]|nr:nucleoside monophosphate kinase [Candidatus Paceibacterota bacterium]